MQVAARAQTQFPQSIKQKRLSLAKRQGKFKLLAHVHLYPPTHNAGAEWMLHALMKHAKDVRGWDVQVLLDHPPPRSDEWQGIPVRFERNFARLSLEYQFANVVITHLDVTGKAKMLAARRGRPLVHLVHNHKQLAFHKVAPKNAALVIFNSEWLQKEVNWPGRSTILYPPTLVNDYKVEKIGEAVTMVNLSQPKGAETFYAVAKKLPQFQFIGVKGSYGYQEKPKGQIPNLTIYENMADIREIYSQTKLLLMPSYYESWGRVAVEAACSGIPSICAPTPGLKEAGVGAAFIAPANIAAWRKGVKTLMEDDYAWVEASMKARKRAEELDGLVAVQLDEVCDQIESL